MVAKLPELNSDMCPVKPGFYRVLLLFAKGSQRRRKRVSVLQAQRKVTSYQSWTSAEEVLDRWGQSMVTMVETMESQYPIGDGHSARVANAATRLATALKLPASDIAEIRLGALLHDIGKLAVPYEILHKNGSLTPDEFRQVKVHPLTGAKIVRPMVIEAAPRIADMVLYHHEHFDGGGYPFGLAGESIPLWGRICCIADSWDAMTSPRPYRSTWSTDQAMMELLRHAGKQFDPDLVKLFVYVMQKNLFEETNIISHPSSALR